MCYPKPGPRCSNCTWATLQKLLKTMDTNIPEQAERLRQAMLAWQKTPDGISNLRAKGKTQLADLYESQRAQQLAAYHAHRKAKEAAKKKTAQEPAGSTPVAALVPKVPAPGPQSVAQVVERVPGAASGSSVLVSGKRHWVVAPKDKTAMMCSVCEEFLPANHPYGSRLTVHGAQGVRCLTPGCNSRLSTTSITHPYLGVAHDSAKFFDPQEVANARWYHVTHRGDEWYESLFSSAEEKAVQFGRDSHEYLPLVHLGTLQASQERMRARDSHAVGLGAKPEWRLYEVSLKDVTDISPVVTLDDNQYAPQQVGDLWSRRSTPGVYSEASDYRAITRYVNQYESIGSMSLIADPSRFTIENVTVVR